MSVVIPAIVERIDHKIIDRAAVTICSLSVTGVGIRHAVLMPIGEEFTIRFSGLGQKRHAIRCVVTGCNAAKGHRGFIVGADFLE